MNNNKIYNILFDGHHPKLSNLGMLSKDRTKKCVLLPIMSTSIVNIKKKWKKPYFYRVKKKEPFLAPKLTDNYKVQKFHDVYILVEIDDVPEYVDLDSEPIRAENKKWFLEANYNNMVNGSRLEIYATWGEYESTTLAELESASRVIFFSKNDILIYLFFRDINKEILIKTEANILKDILLKNKIIFNENNNSVDEFSLDDEFSSTEFSVDENSSSTELLSLEFLSFIDKINENNNKMFFESKKLALEQKDLLDSIDLSKPIKINHDSKKDSFLDNEFILVEDNNKDYKEKDSKVKDYKVKDYKVKKFNKKINKMNKKVNKFEKNTSENKFIEESSFININEPKE